MAQTVGTDSGSQSASVQPITSPLPAAMSGEANVAAALFSPATRNLPLFNTAFVLRNAVMEGDWSDMNTKSALAFSGSATQGILS